MIERQMIETRFDFVVTLDTGEHKRGKTTFRASDVVMIKTDGFDGSDVFFFGDKKPKRFHVPFDELRDAIFGPPVR